MRAKLNLCTKADTVQLFCNPTMLPGGSPAKETHEAGRGACGRALSPHGRGGAGQGGAGHLATQAGTTGDCQRTGQKC